MYTHITYSELLELIYIAWLDMCVTDRRRRLTWRDLRHWTRPAWVQVWPRPSYSDGVK